MIRWSGPEDTTWILAKAERLGGPCLVSGGRLHDIRGLPARIAMRDGERSGFSIAAPLCAEAVELLALLADPEGQGTGRHLLQDAVANASASGARRMVLDTTNDALRAQTLYRKAGFRLIAEEKGGFARVLALKGIDPAEPVIGQGGVEIRNILRFEKVL
ncbi:MAG: GNAT family N-acetyltransferase [Pseudomonadota bacterium]